jgi:glycerophosphoryl diester phosphodiesterase
MGSNATAAPAGARGAVRPEAPPPFVVAHRAGNHVELLRAAEEAGVAVVEADVRLFRGRLEVRHLKTVGPIPLLWDRWKLAAPWRRRLLLGDVLEATHEDTELMLDLKGWRGRLAELVVGELAPYLGERRFTVCARSAALLEPFEGLPVRRVQSVGSLRQLRSLCSGTERSRLDGIAAHERLLDARVVAELRTLADLVLTWPVNGLDRAAELVAAGVDGLITDDHARITPAAVLERLAWR